MDKIRRVGQHEIGQEAFDTRLKLKPVVIALGIALGVAGTLTACDDDDDNGRGSAGTLTARSIGGAAGSASGFGGNGGDITLYAGGTGDIIEILTSASGAPDISTLPVSPMLGAKVWSIAADTTLAVTATEPDVDTPYQVSGDCHVYVSDGDGEIPESAGGIDTDEPLVTGIEIAAGATLTLQDHEAGDTCVDISDDLANAGHIVPEMEGSNIRLLASSYFGDEGSTVNTSGGATSPDAGRIDIWVDTSIYNAGNMTCTGADSSTGNGGAGGQIWMDTDTIPDGRAGNGTNVWNTGTLDCSGGDSTFSTGVGGLSGAVYLYLDSVNTGTLVSAGELFTRGGDGPAGGGNGNIAKVAAWGNQGSDMYVTASIHTEGGSVTGTDGDGGAAGVIKLEIEQDGGRMALLDFHDLTTAGASGPDGGGDGGDVELYTDAEDISHMLNEAVVDTRGGDATSATGSNFAGHGGDFLMWTYGGDGDMENNGAANTSGGNATSGYGGSGGDIKFYNDGGIGNVTNRGKLTAEGGDGTEWGGEGGYVYLYVSTGDDPTEVAVENHASISTRGGNATTGPAGDGGSIEIEIEFADGSVLNEGDLDSSGGNSTGGIGGDAGYVEVEFENGNGGANNSATNNGNITANGGTGAYGGEGGGVDFYSPGMPNTNNGNVSTQGGDGAQNGGDGGDMIYNYGDPFKNTGKINTSGGNGAAGYGGDGGDVTMYSPDAGTSNSFTPNTAGGTGALGDGLDGIVTID